MRRWKRVDTAQGPRFVSALDHNEVMVLKSMAASVQEMLDARQSSAPSDPLEQITGIRTGNTAPPTDSTLSRLLPDFVRPGSGAPEAAETGTNSALRSLHEPEIIDAKIAAAQRLLDTLPEGGGRLELTEDDVTAWVAAINDQRLALGTMLGIGPETPDRLPDGDPKAAHLGVYQWLTALQEHLVLGLMGLMDKPTR